MDQPFDPTLPWDLTIDAAVTGPCLAGGAGVLASLSARARERVREHLPVEGASTLPHVASAIDAVLSALPTGHPERSDLELTRASVTPHQWASCGCANAALGLAQDTANPHLAALGTGPWAVLGEDHEPVADLNDELGFATLANLTNAHGNWSTARLAWDPDGTLTVRLTGQGATSSLTAHQMRGPAAVTALSLEAGQYDYSIEHPYCLAQRHDPDLVTFAMDLFDSTPAFREEIGYLDHVIETLESAWPLAAHDQVTLAALADGWAGDMDELLATALAIQA